MEQKYYVKNKQEKDQNVLIMNKYYNAINFKLFLSTYRTIHIDFLP